LYVADLREAGEPIPVDPEQGAVEWPEPAVAVKRGLAYHATSDTFPAGTLKGMITDIGWTDADLRRLKLL
jgi:hypothetical protein